MADKEDDDFAACVLSEEWMRSIPPNTCENECFACGIAWNGGAQHVCDLPLLPYSPAQNEMEVEVEMEEVGGAVEEEEEEEEKLADAAVPVRE